MAFIFQIIILILALIGFSLAGYIRTKKRSKKKLVCPMRSNCDTVIHSDYSRVLGIGVETLGAVYYSAVAVVTVALIVTGFWSVAAGVTLLIIAFSAVLFSLYLVTLQAFVLRHFCIWCLSSACTSLFILIFTYLFVMLQ